MFPRSKFPATLVLLVFVVELFRGDSLTCHPAEYEVNNECCPMCQAGSRVKTDCTKYRSTSCLPCLEGTFTERPNGMKRCLSCTVCDPGSGLTVRRSCSVTSDTVCDTLEGFVCLDSTEDGCTAARKHRSCEPGQYIHQKGSAFTDTVCSNCSQGTFSNGSTTTCQPHTSCEEINLQQLTAGTSSTDAQCGAKTETLVVVVAVVVVLVVFVIVAVFGVLALRWKVCVDEDKTSRHDAGEKRPSVDVAMTTHFSGNGRSENMEEVLHPEEELKLFNRT